MALEERLPNELVEQIVVAAWTSVIPFYRWALHNAITCINRRWRAVMRNVRLSVIILETPTDLLWYCHLAELSKRPTALPSESAIFRRSYIRTTFKYLDLVGSLFPDCAYLDIRVFGKSSFSYMRARLTAFKRLPDNFASLSYVAVTWPVTPPSLIPPTDDGHDVPALRAVHTLSLHFPAANDPRELAYTIPMLSRAFPNVTTLRLQGPFPMTLVVGFFPKTEVVLLDTPRTGSSDTIPDTCPCDQPELDSGKTPMTGVSLTVLWTITAAVRSRTMKSLKRVVLRGCAEKPAGWDRIREICAKHEVVLDHEVAFKAT